MRTRHSARGATEAKALPFVDLLPYLHFNFGKMHVLGGEVLPVIDDHQVAFVEHALGNDHDTVIGGNHRRSRRRVEVSAAMDAGQLSIEHTAGSKGVRWRERHRRAKAAFP